jgi:hypothetical protein
MNITFNIDSQYAEVHKFSFLQTTALAAMIISGIAFWIAAAVVLLDPIYQ